MLTGIEALTFYCPRYYLDLKVLAESRGVPFEKFYSGIGQEKMSIPAPGEDIVTMGANAAAKALKDVDLQTLDAIIMATESGIDQSKAAAIYLHRLLELPSTVKAFEVKQACCSSTMALQMALAQVTVNPAKKILVVAADVARYGFGTPGEATQGAGAAAILVSAEPKLLAIDPESGSYTEDVMDFWRPNYLEEALVDGKFSMKMYLKALTHAWKAYVAESGRGFASLDRLAYHLPFTRMAEKAHAHLVKLAGAQALSSEDLAERLRDSLHYSRLVGNCYTASLYISLLSLLENTRDDLSGQRVGLFSYGSGCVGTFFSGVVQEGYQNALHRVNDYRMLTDRTPLSIEQYESFFSHGLPEDGSDYTVPVYPTGRFRLAGVAEHQRRYEAVDAAQSSRLPPSTACPQTLSAMGEG